MSFRHRRCIVLRGTPTQTYEQAQKCVVELAPEAVLWVGAEDTAPHGVRRLLGQAFEAVVLSLHDGLDADVLGQIHGLIWGGGALILRLPDGPIPRSPKLVTHPFDLDAVGTRFSARFEAILSQFSCVSTLGAAVKETQGTDQQAHVVAALTRVFLSEFGYITLLADRGRGKSSALGLAIRAACLERPLQVAVTARQPGSVTEVLRFADSPTVSYVRPGELVDTPQKYDIIVVDEAAQLPVPTLQRIVGAHPRARIAFATTTRGYEGTGRGFVLRFLAWLDAFAQVKRLTLTAPIRWGADDPLERFVFNALMLDAEPHPVQGPLDPTQIIAVEFDRDELAADSALLSHVFGLLVHAHYRTTPSDLHRILDAPNLRLHGLLHAGQVIAVTLVALEGELKADLIDDLYWGRCRIRGHAIPETLICHCGIRQAGSLRIIRSVRIAVHPNVRLQGLGRRLVDHVHQCYQPDLFGTVFGATPGLLQFRRAVGYRLARVGISAGTRTGEPSVVMLRAVTAQGTTVFNEVRGHTATDLPTQLSLMRSAGGLHLESTFEESLLADLPDPTPLTPERQASAVAMYVRGPRPFEAAALPTIRYVQAHRSQLAALPKRDRILIEARILDQVTWIEAAKRAGLPSIRAAMRALRRAMQAIDDHP